MPSLTGPSGFVSEGGRKPQRANSALTENTDKTEESHISAVHATQEGGGGHIDTRYIKELKRENVVVDGG